MIAPIITKPKPMICDIDKDPTATTPIPAKSNRIPPIITKTAITVTPVGRFFISNSSMPSKGVDIDIHFYVYISQDIHKIGIVKDSKKSLQFYESNYFILITNALDI